MKQNTMICLCVTALLFTGCSNKKSSQPKNLKVKTTEVKIANTIDHYNYSGTIVPSITIPLGFQMPGTITKILVEEGDKVKEQDILAETNKTSAQSLYDGAFAMEQQAIDAYTRLKSVYDKGSLPEIQWQEVKSKLAQARSSRQIAQKNLDNCRLKAPQDGIICKRGFEPGQNALPGIPVLNLVSIDPVYIKISVAENEINWIKKGMSAQIYIQAVGPDTLSAVVEKVGIVAHPISKTYEVKLKMDNPDLIAKPGMACDVYLNFTNHKPLLLIPSRAVQKDHNNSTFVFTYDPETKKVKKRAIKTGNFNNNDLEVLSGLAPSEIVVIEGQHKLLDNMDVTIGQPKELGMKQ